MKIGYLSKSKFKKTESLDAQIDSFKALGIKEKNIYIDKSLSDDAKSSKLTSCLNSLKENDTLILWKLDALASNLKQLILTIDKLLKNNIEIKVLSGQGKNIEFNTSNGQMIVNLFSLLASIEGKFSDKQNDTVTEPTLSKEAKKGATKPPSPPKQVDFGIFIQGIQTQEKAIFDKVIALKIALGLSAHTVKTATDAKLIIVTDDVLKKLSLNKNQASIVISKNSQEGLGDINITSPMNISEARAAFNKVIDIINKKQTESKGLTKSKSDSIKPDPKDNIIEGAKLDSKETTPPAKSKETSEKRPYHALVIDDSLMIHKQLEIELQNAGITMDFVTSGEDALVQAKKQKYDLMFLDVMMPGIDGYETCKQLRATTSYKKTPIIMLSGKTSPLDEVKGVMVGATTYLTKPIVSAKFQETLKRISKWLESYTS